ncbi:HK97 family phage prohead protease [Acidipropionibacterium timonense]|uniref:HK97 family phage prohead protease n=1 Tax=Acidipropionibacterium timonense TaxID=2161818 RepID=UPI0014367F3C|nr:HK97 family phage prohead protease [Acidipropionibacterium timonense]
MPDLETRSLAITRAQVDGDERTFVGRVVPWDTPTTLLPGLDEQFARGSVRIDDNQPPMLFRDHTTPIGTIRHLDDQDDGLYITARISATRDGDDTLTLIRDGVLDRLSVGFQPISADETSTTTGTLITRTDVILREASVVPFPAYPTAKITEHRNTTPEGPTMTDTITRADLDNLATRDDLDDISRRLDTLAATIDAVNTWQDRAYSGATLDDIPAVIPQGIETLITNINDANPIAQLFKTASLPDTGMVVNFLRIKDTTITTGKQAKPGDDLPGPSKVSFETTAAPIEVYGAWTELDLATISRYPVPELDTQLTRMATDIGRQRAQRLADTLTQTVTDRAKTTKLTISSISSADAWSDGIVDAQLAYLDTGYPVDGLLVAPDVFKAMRKLKDGSGSYIMATYGTNQNTVGVIDGLSGMLGPIRVSLFWLAAPGTMAFYSKNALSVRSQPIVQLQDTNVVNLTGQWSLHQLSAICVEQPQLILPVVATA